MFGTPRSLSPAGRAVVVTGASTGLGRACALHLDRLGFRVHAGVRKAADGEQLAAEARHGLIHPLTLDLTSEESVREAAASVAAAEGRGGLWGLVNNAGICVSAPLEGVPAEQLRAQLDVNVVGTVLVTQSFLPGLRRARGRVVNVTSGLGSVAIPYLGAYAAAQFAKEAVSDALRRELRSSGIAVSVVQPGAIMTPIWEKVSGEGQRILDAMPDGVAAHYRETFPRFLAANERKARESRTRPEHFARAVHHALTAGRPRTRYRVGPDATGASVLARLLPDAALDRLFTGITAAAPARPGAPVAPAPPHERTT
ncbi:SDR family NAD(P)-dependent oxidoreductase [Streptomyces sp. NPDC046215]|uniref:SDR family NAD(P)-dependent oxidoreductase n=1 Tax=Streptomyces stramineus TaxID=173861 RepID=A0ABN1ADQ0_9ACTN